ncbi:phospholipase D2 isoform X2 [Cimex lectularius]|nr:phospholipase D2 isoform X2 [Cimex lectularius]
MYRASLNVPFPTKTHKERRTSFKNEVSKDKSVKKHFPRFPAKPEALVPYDKIDERMKQLEDYLNNLLKIKLYRNHHETIAFLEVSELSFIGALGVKGMEGPVQKRTRSAYPRTAGCNICGCCDSGLCVRCHYICGDLCATWRSRWLIVKDSFVAYIRPKDGRVKAVILFDSGFDVSSGVFTTGRRKGLHITNMSRQILLNCPTRRTAREWQAYIKDMVRQKGADFTQRNRYFSFTPVRPFVKCAWFVDGKSYMAAVATALEQAKEEIYIADWWLSPEIYMKRPALQGDYWRLDKILQRKAADGVKIFILLYKEVEMAIGINSFYSKQKLTAEGSQNIKVLRHPDHAKAGILFWAHHEKMVVIDQSLAFLGGIDLCYGRWDDYKHRLTDLGSQVDGGNKFQDFMSLSLATHALAASVLALKSNGENGNVNNNTDGDEVYMQPTEENVKCNTPELERKSLFDTVKTRGKEWMNLWSFNSDEDEDIDLVDNTKDTRNMIERERESASILTQETLVCPEMSEDDLEKGMITEEPAGSKLWVGKDYTNFILKDFENLDLPFQDLVDRTKTARMPWHDVGVMVKGTAARDLARHFIQRWNAVKLEKSKINPQYPYLLPKSYNEYSHFELPGVREISASCQVVRSLSQWSGGFIDQETWEGSIHEALVDAIAKARYYVYIENQFFISLGSQSSQVRNQVADALFKRIVRAHREGSVFRVFVVLPLLPGFEGEVGTPSGTALHAITHWNYASICRGKNSLIMRLKDAGIPDPDEYITFHGLRTHSILNKAPITELIYVHSKLLIADDRLMICGSANINDRSLLGKRDSEIAVVIEDEEFKEGQMNGATFLSGKLCGALRRFLFKEHLGILGSQQPTIDVTDPISRAFYHNVWRRIAKSNSEIYEKVFHCIPSDQIKTFKDLNNEIYYPKCLYDPEAAVKDLEGVQGHLVMFPLEFLKDEVLTPNPMGVQGMLPTSLWT